MWSKIGYKTQDIDLKNYRDNHLFTKQENACQVNLYPLGRANQHEWPDHYENLFGISSSKDDKKLYTKEVRMKRIPKIKEIWDDYAKVTVCIGKKRWEEFTKLFKLEGKTPIIKTFGKRTVKIYSVGFNKIIIFSYFFQGMSDIETLFISKRIREHISF